jgi:hypothetical protein
MRSRLRVSFQEISQYYVNLKLWSISAARPRALPSSFAQAVNAYVRRRCPEK